MMDDKWPTNKNNKVRKEKGLSIAEMDNDPERFEAARKAAITYIQMIKDDEENNYFVDWIWIDPHKDEIGTIFRFWRLHKEKLDNSEIAMCNWLKNRF
jgi:hypothetical protein